MRMKHAPWSDSRWPSKCSSGIPAHFLANPPEYRTFLAVGPFAIHDRALAQRIYKTEDTMAKTHKWTASTFVSMVHENLTEKGHKVKKSDLSWAVKDAFQAAISAPLAWGEAPSNARLALRAARVGRGPVKRSHRRFATPQTLASH